LQAQQLQKRKKQREKEALNATKKYNDMFSRLGTADDTNCSRTGTGLPLFAQHQENRTARIVS
jgi:hypothetical protein